MVDDAHTPEVAPEGVFVHARALCESRQVGPGSRVWAFAHILPGARLGADCNVCDHVFIENDVVVGDRVTIKCGVQLWDGIELGDDVFIGPNATFCNDRMPRSKCYPAEFLKTRVEARIVGYVDTLGHAEPGPSSGTVAPALEGGVQLIRLPLVKDMRGDLTVGEFGRSLPFTPRRYFMVMNVPSQEVRGEHAHRECEQLLLCVRGRCQVMTDDGSVRREFTLDDPTLGLYLPPMTWGVQYKHSADALLLVFASHYYDADDYIRDYQCFLDTVAAGPGPAP